MKKVEFKFDLDEKVKTAFGEVGFISMCALDDGGNVYYVKTSNHDKWLKETQIIKL